MNCAGTRRPPATRGGDALVEHLGLGGTQRRRGIDAELVAQEGSHPLVLLERGRLVPRASQRPHQHRPAILVERRGFHEPSRDGGGLDRARRCGSSLDEGVLRLDALRLQVRRPRPRRTAHRPRRPWALPARAPTRRGAGPPQPRDDRSPRPPWLRQRADRSKARRSRRRAWSGDSPPPCARSFHHTGPAACAAARAASSAICPPTSARRPPHRVDQRLGRHRRSRVHGEAREHRALSLASDLQRLVIEDELHRSQQAQLGGNLRSAHPCDCTTRDDGPPRHRGRGERWPPVSRRRR